MRAPVARVLLRRSASCVLFSRGARVVRALGLAVDSLLEKVHLLLRRLECHHRDVQVLLQICQTRGSISRQQPALSD